MWVTPVAKARSITSSRSSLYCLAFRCTCVSNNMITTPFYAYKAKERLGHRELSPFVLSQPRKQLILQQIHLVMIVLLKQVISFLHHLHLIKSYLLTFHHVISLVLN